MILTCRLCVICVREDRVSPCIVSDYADYMDYMDFDVRCLGKAVKCIHFYANSQSTDEPKMFNTFCKLSDHHSCTIVSLVEIHHDYDFTSPHTSLYQSMYPERCHNADFVVISGTEVCHNDTLYCRHWWQSQKYNNYRNSVDFTAFALINEAQHPFASEYEWWFVSILFILCQADVLLRWILDGATRVYILPHKHS